MNSQRSRRGMTLLELLITLAILAIVAGVAVLAIHDAPVTPPGDPRQLITTTRRQALETGRAITVMVAVDSVAHLVTVFPDGSVLADSALNVQRLNAVFHADSI